MHHMLPGQPGRYGRVKPGEVNDERGSCQKKRRKFNWKHIQQYSSLAETPRRKLLNQVKWDWRKLNRTYVVA